MLKSVNNISAKQIILGVDFNLYFNSLLKNKGGNPILKIICITKMIELKNTFELCNRNPISKDLLFSKIIGLALLKVY